jgi:hypothetical protein
VPREKSAKGFASMAYFYAPLGSQFCECQPELRKQEQRIVSEAAHAAWLTQKQSFGVSAKCLKDLSTARGCNHADEASAAAIIWNRCKFRE